MLTPKDYIGSLMELGQDRRGVFKEMNFISENRASIVYELPLAEVFIIKFILSLKGNLNYLLFNHSGPVKGNASHGMQLRVSLSIYRWLETFLIS